MELYEEISRLRKNKSPCAIGTIVKAIGSSPGKVGAKILVRYDGSTMGTTGGGEVEAKIIELALSSISDGIPKTVPFDLNEKNGGLLCGGQIVVFIEPVLPKPRMLILGAGHVGKALSAAARFSGFEVTVIDDRPEYANRENLPDADTIVVNEFSNPFMGIEVDAHSYVVIATRGHTHDLEALRAALGTGATYIGLVGSRSKKLVLLDSLRDFGFPDEVVQRVIIPVGLPIGSVTPEEISISIMAQIIAQRRNHVSEDFGNSACSGNVQAPRAGQGTPSAQ